jgi:hypothetical protein
MQRDRIAPGPIVTPSQTALLEIRASGPMRARPRTLEEVSIGHRPERQNPRGRVEGTAAGREGKGARERFERRAQEIARAAEVGEGSIVPEVTDPATLGQQRLPEIGDQRSLSGGDPRQQVGRENANAGVQERGWAFAAESRDAVPFGLQRRVAVGLPVLDDEQGRRGLRRPVGREQGGGLEGDRRVGVDDQEVVSLEPPRGVSQRPRGPQYPGFPEELELRKVARLLAEAALDLVAQVVEIDARLADAAAAQALEVRPQERDVQEGQEGLGNRVGHRPEPLAAPGGKEEGLHGKRPV